VCRKAHSLWLAFDGIRPLRRKVRAVKSPSFTARFYLRERLSTPAAVRWVYSRGAQMKHSLLTFAAVLVRNTSAFADSWRLRKSINND
jgi:hypothetical protein